MSRKQSSSRAQGQQSLHRGGGRGHRANFATVEHAKNPVATLRRLLGMLKGRRRFLALLAIPLAVGSLTGLVWPRALGLATDVMTQKPVDFRRLAIVMAIGFGAQVLGQLAAVAQGYGTTILSNHSVRDMRRMLFSHAQSLPVARFDSMAHGEFMSRLTNDIDMVANTLGPGVLQFIGTLVTLLGTFGFMLWISWKMTLVACLTLPLTFLIGRLIVRISRKLFRQRQKVVGELNGLVEEMITGQRVVQAFCRESQVEAAFNAMSGDLRRIGIRAESLGGLMGPSMNLVNNLSFLLVVAAGGWLALQGSITVGVIISFMMYSRQFGRPINQLASQFNMIQSAIAGAERVFALLDMPSEPDCGALEIDRADVRGDIRFENVKFGYRPDTPVLHDFSLHVKPGQKIALVGETGSGKTTIINLLTRFYEPDEGRILLDGVNLREITKRSLRSCMAVVLQDTHLFSGTVAENIGFGTPDATPEQIAAAARFANADVFIERLPEGYETRLNQADTALSQGQCQLLAIARAALADPAVLILDEATSNVDTRTEMHIQQAMVRLMKGRTSLIIAHRLSTIRDADVILVLDNGRLVESGSHDELLARNGAYAALHRRQPIE
ncbi:MAG: ABC transporter ATP-binding protein [Kiritimatiellia bacterium]|jgi:ATP-binding cassette subfamily B multidrug efflux pump